jgi:hypothetical protein
MADKANPYGSLFASRKGDEPEVEAVAPEETPEEVKEAKPAAKKTTTKRSSSKAAPKAQPEPKVEAETTKPVKRGRGRPAGGKRSDDRWIGRTYYIQEDNDIQCEVELALLRTQGIEMDKSDLIDSLVNTWIRHRRGEKVAFKDISPRREE